MSEVASGYTVRDLVREVERLVALHGGDGPKLMDGLREPVRQLLATDLTKVGVKREGNHIENSKYLYYDGNMSITFDHIEDVLNERLVRFVTDEASRIGNR
jgi:hypothetical protein